MVRSVWVVALLAVVMAACTLSRPVPPKHTWLLDTARPQTSQEQPPLPGVLVVGSVNVAEAFAGRPMVYRFGENRYESDYYNEFFVAPRDMLAQRILEWLQSAHLYETVTPLAGAQAPDARMLQAFVNEMYADVRDRSRPAAVLSIQFYITAADRSGKPVRFAQQLREVAPMRDDSAQAYAQALSQALAAILTELERQVRAARP